MAIPVVCTCGKRLQVRDELAGKRAKCPGCGKILTITAPAAKSDLEPLSDLGSLDLGSLGPVGSSDPLAGPLPGAGSPLAGGPLQSTALPGQARPADSSNRTVIYVACGLGGLALLVVIGAIIAGTMGSGPSAPPAVANVPTITPAPATTPPPAAGAPAPPTPVASAPKLAIKPPAAAEVAIEPGKPLEIEIAVERGGVSGPIQLVAQGLPATVTAAPVEIAADQSAAKIVLQATPEAAEASQPIKIVATAGSVTADQALTLAIKPAPPPSVLPIGAVSLSPGNEATVDLQVERNGHVGPIAVQVQGLPAGVTMTPLTIPQDQSTGKLEFTAAANAAEGKKAAQLSISLAGKTAQSELPLTVEKFAFRLLPLAEQVVWITPGQTLPVPVKLERRSFKGPLNLAVEGLPELVTAAPLTVEGDKLAAELQITAATEAKDRVRSAKVVATGGPANGQTLLIVRVKKDDGALLPEVGIDENLKSLWKRGSFGGRTTSDSKLALRDIYGGTKESEAAVLKGLEWLAEHQSPNGSWSLQNHKQSSDCDCANGGAEVLDNNTAGTAFGVLPFLGAGITPDKAPESPLKLKQYRKNVKAALEFLVKNQKTAEGASMGDLGGGMYSHALGTIALCEASALTGDEKLKVPAQRAVKYLLAAQSNKTGGWGYGPRQDGDTSVVGWVFLAIRSGQMSGVPIESRVLDAADKYLDDAAAGPEPHRLSRYAYKPELEPKLALTAAGLLSRQYLGWKQDRPDLLEGAKYIMQNQPPEAGDTVGPNYYYYYATQVLHHMEGKDWDLWNHKMREHLIRTQEKTGHALGSWNPVGSDWGTRGGRLYSTSLSLLTLEVYYRHLPLYRKAAKPARVAAN